MMLAQQAGPPGWPPLLYNSERMNDGIFLYILTAGLTESCGGCFTSIANIFPMIGSVGVPMTTIEARPEMGYDALSTVPRGEICLRGNTLFSGYHKRQDLTNEVFVDGWFHTGKTSQLEMSILNPFQTAQI